MQEKSQPLIKDSLKSDQEKGCKVVQEEIQEKGTPRSQKEEIPREIQEERKRVQNTEMKKRKSVKDADKNKFNSVLKMFREMEEKEKKKKEKNKDPGKSPAKPLEPRTKLTQAESQKPHHSPVIIRTKLCKTPRKPSKSKLRLNSEIKSKPPRPKPKGGVQIGVNLADIRTFFEKTAPRPSEGSSNTSIFNFISSPSQSPINAQLITSLNNREKSAGTGPYTIQGNTDTELTRTFGHNTLSGDHQDMKIGLKNQNITTTQPPPGRL